MLTLFKKNKLYSLLVFLAIEVASSIFCSINVSAQVVPPDREYLFLQDKLKKVNTRQQKKEIAQKRTRAASSKITKGGDSLPFDISASTLDFDTSGSILKAAGSVIISYSSMIAESSEAKVNTVTNEAELTKDVRISDVNANLTAQNALVNLGTGESKLDDVSLYFLEGNYSVQAKEASRSAKDEYSLKNAILTTCSCPEGEDCRPWSLSSSEATIERDGYGQAWGSSLRVYDVPVFYLPYIFFPAKTDRQSGFLPATFGIGRRDGFLFNLPFFWDIDDSTDLTITSLYESRVRVGGQLDGRKVFSRNHNFEFGGLYVDESERLGKDGKPLLLGTRVDGLADKNIDTHRFGGYVNELWSKKIFGQPFQWIVDAHYVSDDFIAREIQNTRIADQNSRFLTSSGTLRTPVGDSLSLDLYTEYNQSLGTTKDSAIFQRLPQLSLTGMNFYRPFGTNPYGLRMVVSHSVDSTNFVREQDYSGMRNEVNENVTLPFFFGNYFEGSLKGGVRASKYSLTTADQVDLNTGGSSTPLPDSSDRLVPTMGGRMGTVFEGIYDITEGNPIKLITELGTLGKTQELVRAKHTIEPGLSYLYVPDVDQSENPQF